MVNWINSWAQGIIVVVIISTIIEMIMPSGSAQKYIKTVIGIYIVFIIVSPIFSLFTNKDIELQDAFNIATVETASIQTDIIDTNKYIEENYIETIKQEIVTNLKAKGYEVSVMNIEIETKNQEDYGKLKYINLSIDGKVEETTEVQKIRDVNITISDAQDSKYLLTEDEKRDLKQYLKTTYNINEEYILIN